MFRYQLSIPRNIAVKVIIRKCNFLVFIGLTSWHWFGITYTMNEKVFPSVFFITGAFVHNSCWDEWRKYFEANGFETKAPSWPHKNAPAEVLRNRQPDAAIASNRLAEVTDYFADAIKEMDKPPVLIGHSIGGLIVQLLLQQGIGTAGVAIHPVAPQGVFTFKVSFLKAGWGALGFFTSARKSYLMPFKTWQYGFTNGMAAEEQKEGYYRFAIPESKLIVRDTVGKAAHVNYNAKTAPLLITAGSTDRTIPPSLNYANYKKYRKNSSLTEYKQFEGRNHFVLGQPSWKEDADYILNWLSRI